MDETIDNRVTRLEFRMDAQEQKTEDLEDSQEDFGSSLKAIEKVLLQIKWALYGGGLVFAVNVLGLKEVITKLVLH
ncbi:hypothetical protein AWB76_07228 [Caballeronia temeraria]|uniref:Uncharacterized protein n=1 Tax=Caballeronia temeraria TaxID=1777137 RepID=A0A158DMZ6_9BURK|nr:hypothetical protein [Caballeronia temeraria]SAK95964.1 hypothetical protein AWB76_07228 [Caballeronia temeraria]